MAPQMINILLSSFAGLGLPTTLSLPVERSTPITDLRRQLYSRLPCLDSRLILTTTANKEVLPSEDPASSLLSSDHDTILPLRLSVPLCGGKGGFGSQLRAAGGRMSSKRKNNQGDANSSNRNLDGRRLRTVNEAKNLAEYLALKPEMDRKEKEARRKRWEQVVALAEKREEEVRSGSKGKVDGRWMEDKEEAGERAREAVLAAMKAGDYHDNLKGSSGGSSDSISAQRSEESDDKSPGSTSANRITVSSSKPTSTMTKTYLGFDEDDEFMSADEEDGEPDVDGEELSGDVPVVISKGKGKAMPR
ncbi:replication stress response regulator SDE2, partial [Lecanoromycetidae sp. Uapishka_2]